MKWKISYLKLTVPIVLLTLYIISCKTEKNKVAENSGVMDTAWSLLPFVKVDSVNPILEPGENTFRCPILKRDVRGIKRTYSIQPLLSGTIRYT